MGHDIQFRVCFAYLLPIQCLSITYAHDVGHTRAMRRARAHGLIILLKMNKTNVTTSNYC